LLHTKKYFDYKNPTKTKKKKKKKKKKKGTKQRKL
jgi:hypothetical protein